MKKIDKISFSKVDSIDKDYEEFVVSYYYKNKSRERYIFVKKDPKIKKDSYLKLAKKEFQNDIKSGKIDKDSHRKTPIVVLCSTIGALAIALTVFFISKNSNAISPVISDAITFDSQGGVLELYDKAKVEVPYTKGTTWSTFYPENKYIGAVKNGYDFLCWSLDGSNPIPNDYVFNKPVTLKPIYVQNRDCITISCRYLDDRYTTPTTDYNISFEWPQNEPDIPGDVYYAINNGNFNQYETSGEQLQGNLQSAGDYFSFKTDDIILPPISPTEAPFRSKFSIKLNDSNNKTRFALSGPIDALTGKKDFPDLGYTGVFETIFSESNGICSARGINLDVNHSLTNGVFAQMFALDTNLLFPPDLPATTLSVGCYRAMFNSCSSLLVAPTLPAKTMTNACYIGMFSGCTSLTEAPTLPATTLAESCYEEMFNGCTSITTAPELPVLIIANSCYKNMFQNCTSLISAPTNLPSLNVPEYAYSYMFSGCTSLTTAPELFFETRSGVGSGLYYMFRNCTSLNYVKIHFTGQLNFRYWLQNVSPTGDFYYNGTVPPTRTGDTIPAGWDVHTF